MRVTRKWFWLCLLLALPIAASTWAEEAKEETPANEAAKADAKKEPPPEPRQIIHGTVRDAATGQPLANATVAIRTRRGGVVAWGKTNEKGEYQIVGPWVEMVRLPEYRERNTSILGAIVHGAGKVTGGVVSLAARGAGMVLKPAAKAAASAAGGPVAAAVAGEISDRIVRRPVDKKLPLPDPNDPAVFIVKVVCADHWEYQGPVQAYWMNPPDPDGVPTLMFWLDPIALAPRKGDEEIATGPRTEGMRLREAVVEPGIAARGTDLTISVRLDMPDAAVGAVRILARHEKTGETTVLEPVPGQRGLFRGRMKVGPNWPLNDQHILLLALRATPASPEGPRSASPEALAERLDLWKTRKLVFDPQIMASRDREALVLTVVQ